MNYNLNNLTYDFTCDSYPNRKNALNIWIKFVNCFTDEELSILKECQNKSINEFTPELLSEYLKIKKQVYVSKLFLKYKNKNCNEEEYAAVQDFMNKNKLSAFIESKVDLNQKEQSINFITKLIQDNTIEKYIEIREKNYSELDIYESYVLFKAKETLYNINQKIRLERNQYESKLRGEISSKSLNKRVW